MDFFTFLDRYFWLLAILVEALNTAILWRRSQRRIRVNPTLAPGYRTLLRGYWVYPGLLWVVMGIGILWGDVPSIWYFFYPRIGNPYILIWWGVYLLLNSFFGYWLIWGGGAEMLIAHPGTLQGNPRNPKEIKFFGWLMLAGSIAITIIVFSQPSPAIPELSNP